MSKRLEDKMKEIEACKVRLLSEFDSMIEANVFQHLDNFENASLQIDYYQSKENFEETIERLRYLGEQFVAMKIREIQKKKEQEIISDEILKSEFIKPMMETINVHD